jgi:hypothetical protein
MKASLAHSLSSFIHLLIHCPKNFLDPVICVMTSKSTNVLKKFLKCLFLCFVLRDLLKRKPKPKLKPKDNSLSPLMTGLEGRKPTMF